MRYPPTRAAPGAAPRDQAPHWRAGPRLKRERFVTEYLRTGNATKAALVAGYSPRTAYKQGSDLLTHPHVRELLAEAQAAVAVTPERVVAELARLAFANMADFVDENGQPKPVSELTRDQAAAIRKLSASTTRRTDAAGVTRTERSAQLELADKRAALQLLGQHTGIFADGQAGLQTSFTLIVAEPRSPELRRVGHTRKADDEG